MTTLRLKIGMLMITASALVFGNVGLAPAAPPTYNHDMTAYEAMAKEILKLLAANKMKEALSKAEELEEKWDKGTTDLKKADPALWNLIDKQMDAGVESCKGTDSKKATDEWNSYLDKLARVPKPKK
jgi:hypothetical protein